MVPSNESTRRKSGHIELEPVNRKSHSGIVIYVNNAPIIWYSKHQDTVEASGFGLEFLASGIATDMIEDLQYKLNCFGVSLDGPAEVFCDNK